MLGPLQVLFDGAQIPVPAGKGRVLLATLLLRPNQFVSVDELVERLWEDSPPSADRATKTLHTTVARLRQSLGPANCVSTSTNGYLAEVENLDLLRFRSLAGADPHAALAQWRGSALQGLASDSLREDVAMLAEERLAVLERRIELDLEAGPSARLVRELKALTNEHPLRERFWAQLMTALYRSGQRTAALDAFRRISDLLTAELGIDPGLRLRDLHQSILRAEPGLGVHRDIVLPRQLPPDLAHFTGRGDDLATLDRLLPTGTAGQAVVISAIAGSAGVGKTALAVHWAHRVRDRFPDGQLTVNLRGYDRAEPLTSHDALGRLLRGLGVSAPAIPDDTGQRAGAYRTLLADRRVLVLLDNARTAEQVRPLLPAGGRSAVVITSRSDLRGLVASAGAKVLRLGVLPLDEAVRLLERAIGTERTKAEPAATEELARLCACLPLALRIAASMFAGEPHRRIQELVDQLRAGNRLAELEIDGDQDTAVRAAFDLSYAALAPDERRMFRMFGLAPKADLTPQSAGALLGVPSGHALQLLRSLARAHLVEEHSPSRFTLHDLLLLHARECAAAQESDEQRRASVVRFLDHYLHSVGNAQSAMRPTRVELPLTDIESVVEVAAFRESAEALDWCRREFDVLVELCEFTLTGGHLEHAWQLPIGLYPYLYVHGTTSDSMRLFTIALDAAQQLGDRYAEATALQCLGHVCRNMSRYEESLQLQEKAFRIRQEIGHVMGMAASSIGLAGTYRAMKRYDEALPFDRATIEYLRLGQDDTALANALGSLAWTLVLKGDHAEGIETANAAAEVFASLGVTDPSVQDTLAQARFRRGEVEEAAQIYRDIFTGSLEQTGNAGGVALRLSAAEVFMGAGDREAALAHAREAVTIAERFGLAQAEQARRLVRELEG